MDENMSRGYLLLANNKWRYPKFRYFRRSPASTLSTSTSNVATCHRPDKIPRLRDIIAEDVEEDEEYLQSSPGLRSSVPRSPLSSDATQSSSFTEHPSNNNNNGANHNNNNKFNKTHHRSNEKSSSSRNTEVYFTSPPIDRFNGVYLGLILAGIGFLLPYNSFVIAVDYFQDHFPDTTIMFDMSFIYILTALLAVTINNLLVEAVPLFWRINFGYILSFGTLTAVALFEIAYCPFSLTTAYNLNLFAVAVIAFGCTIQQSSFYGYTSMLPTRYTQAVMTGESAAGLIVSSNRIITKLLFNDEQVNTLLFFGISIILIGLCIVIHNFLQRTTFVRYYIDLCSGSTASLSTIIAKEPTVSTVSPEVGRGVAVVEMNAGHEDLSLVDYLESDQRINEISGTSFVPLESPIMSDELARRRWVAHSDSTEFDMPFGIDEEDLANYVPPVLPEPSWKREAKAKRNSNHRSCHEKRKQNRDQSNDSGDPVSWSSDGELVEEFDDEEVKQGTQEDKGLGVAFKAPKLRLGALCNPYSWKSWRTRLSDGLKSRAEISQLIWPYMISIAMAYLVTLSLFPGIESEIIDCSLGSWMPVILMAIFNLTDFIGKIMASWAYNLRPIHLIILSSLRIIIIPLSALCAAPRASPFFPSPVWPFLFSCILGLSNGIVGSVPMILAPLRVAGESKELTGNLMTLSYSLGLTTGSAAAYLIDYLLGPPLHNPTATLCDLHQTISDKTNSTFNSTLLNVVNMVK